MFCFCFVVCHFYCFFHLYVLIYRFPALSLYISGSEGIFSANHCVRKRSNRYLPKSAAPEVGTPNSTPKVGNKSANAKLFDAFFVGETMRGRGESRLCGGKMMGEICTLFICMCKFFRNHLLLLPRFVNFGVTFYLLTFFTS